MQKKYVVLFRHGQTDWNVQGRLQGHTDIALNDTGKDQALQLAQKIMTKKLDIIVSSDLQRASQTAEIVSNECQVPMIIESALRELHLGQAEGRWKQEFEKTSLWKDLWSNDVQFDHLSFADGETKQQAKTRIASWFKKYLQDTPHERIGICAHRRILQLLLLELGYTKIFNFENATYFEIEW